MISRDGDPSCQGEIDAGVPKKFEIEPHKMFSAA